MASADNLEFLDQISGDIFSEVAQRIQESRTRISNIHKRVEVAQSKLDGLKGSRKVTKIFSSSIQVDAESIVDGDMVFYPTHQQNGARRKTPALPSSVSKLGLLIFDTFDFRTPQRQSNSDKSSKSTLRRKHDSEISTDTSIGEADTLPYQDHSDCPWSISSQRNQLERSNPLNFSYMPGKF
jgi:WAS family protein 1